MRACQYTADDVGNISESVFLPSSSFAFYPLLSDELHPGSAFILLDVDPNRRAFRGKLCHCKPIHKLAPASDVGGLGFKTFVSLGTRRFKDKVQSAHLQ
jgi:hypothetical protein